MFCARSSVFAQEGFPFFFFFAFLKFGSGT